MPTSEAASIVDNISRIMVHRLVSDVRQAVHPFAKKALGAVYEAHPKVLDIMARSIRNEEVLRNGTVLGSVIDWVKSSEQHSLNSGKPQPEGMLSAVEVLRVAQERIKDAKLIGELNRAIATLRGSPRIDRMFGQLSSAAL
jgi:hypothetical protein